MCMRVYIWIRNQQVCAGADLQREEDDSEADDRGDAHSYDDGLCVVEAGDHAHHVGQAQGQDGLQERTEKK